MISHYKPEPLGWLVRNQSKNRAYLRQRVIKGQIPKPVHSPAGFDEIINRMKHLVVKKPNLVLPRTPQKEAFFSTLLPVVAKPKKESQVKKQKLELVCLYK